MSDNDSSESAVKAGGGALQVGFPVDDIRQRLDNEEIGVALVLVMTRAERVLGELLRHRYDIAHEEFQTIYGRKSLTWFVETCNTLGLTDVDPDENYGDHLDTLTKKRSKVAHDDGYLKILERNEEERDEVRNTIEKACDWIDEISIEKSPPNPDKDDPTRINSLGDSDTTDEQDDAD